MDIITQSILGATVAQSAARKEHVRLATMIGLVSGIIADADILIRSSADPLLSLEYHRHFSHSIFFIPVGALIAFLLFWPFLRNKLAPRFIYFYCFLGYLLSGFIDACTSYGTHLLWPLSDERISWHIISIIDPVFTGLLFITLIAGFKTLRVNYSRLGLLFAASYLLFATFQLNRAEDSIFELAEQRGHRIEKIMVKPTVGNIILWRSVYLSDNTFYIDAVRAGIGKHIYKGETIKKFNLDKFLSGLDSKSILFNDVNRFDVFSNGFVSEYPGRPEILGDVRYSMNPLGTIPLWGIEMNLADTSQHVKYEFYRVNSKEMRQQFIKMLLGREL